MTFDPAAATAAYLARLSPEAHLKATRYTHGGHWLLLWGTVVSVLVAWLILRSGVLVRIHQRIEGFRRRPNLAVLAISIAFLALSWLLSLPWSIYSGWFRQKQYGLTSQPLLGWFAESVLSLVVSLIPGVIVLLVIYALIRKAPRTWWLWASGACVVLFAFLFIVQPIVVEPLFNKYTPAPAGPVRDAVTTLAEQTGTPHDKIYIYNGSKQSNAYTANVSGLFGSARVAMSDVMFSKGADIAEVRGVMGHEMGHYVHKHILWSFAAMVVLAVAAFWLLDRLFDPAARLMDADNVHGLADPAGLPVVVAVLSVLGLLATPITNSLTRFDEADADRFSLEHAHEPDGLSKALVKTIEYRASSPGRLEELLFYDHPSVERRVRRAMAWKAQHLSETVTPPDAPDAARPKP